jgi:hypothetical protein
VTESEPENSPVSDLDPRASTTGFSLGEMITCDECLRANPPTRRACMYCAASLPVRGNDEERQTTSPAMSDEKDESNGYCLVLAPNQRSVLAESSMAEVASLMHVKASAAESAVNCGAPAPFARTATLEQATVLVNELGARGIQVITVANDALCPRVAPRKIRSLEFSDDSVAAMPASGGGRLTALWDDLNLIVTGRLLVSRLVVEERQRRRGNKPLDSRELFSDKSIIDLYSRSNEAGWRISPGVFDFSCLGSAKAITAFENLTALINLLRARGTNVEVDESYSLLRPLLANVWPVERQTMKSQLRRSGAGKVESTVTTSGNETQFTLYSTLRHWLKLHELEGP